MKPHLTQYAQYILFFYLLYNVLAQYLIWYMHYKDFF